MGGAVTGFGPGHWEQNRGRATLQESVANLARITPSEEEDLKDIALQLRDAIWRAFDGAVPYIRKRQRSLPWWTPQLKEARKKQSKARRAFQKRYKNLIKEAMTSSLGRATCSKRLMKTRSA